MTKNDVKKELYKQNPKAALLLVDKDGVHYEGSLKNGQVLYFSVPFNDLGDAKFYAEMDAKYLIRWLNYDEKPQSSPT